MPLFLVSKVPTDLFGEPDATTPPRCRIDSEITVNVLAKLADWAKVELAEPIGEVKGGWLPLAQMTAVDEAGYRELLVFAEPLTGDGETVVGQVVRTLVEVDTWHKVRLLLKDGSARIGWIVVEAAVQPPPTPSAPTPTPTPTPAPTVELVLGPNEVYREPLREAEKRTGIDAAALAALIDAEAGVISSGPQKGRWNPNDVNADSGAAGLTQFLASTWLGHACIAGTMLCSVAQRDGMVDGSRTVVTSKKTPLLALRLDPMLSIVSAAEYGLANLIGLRQSGLIDPAQGDDENARYMYLAHHEGLAGARNFLKKIKVYSLNDLSIQVGASRAKTLTLEAGGDANRAYRTWLAGYIDLKIRPAKFRTPGATPPAGPRNSDAPPDTGPAAPTEVASYASLGADVQARLTAFTGPIVPFTVIGANVPLATAIQQALSVHGYLDPPADGEFGPVSIWALQEFTRHMRLSIADGLTPTLAKALADPANSLPAVGRNDPFINAIVDYMLKQGYFICRHPDCRNIVYIEGMSTKGVVNDDAPNQFNDVRLVFWLDEAGTPTYSAWEGTTEPGDYWTYNPMNPAGAARIAFRQFKSWAVGRHHPDSPSGHEALVQVKPVTVFRDLNQDHKRTGDKPDTGLFGINQHWGYDAPTSDLLKTSAGCLVGRTKDGHREFMAIVKADARFRTSKSYRFVSAILPGDGLPPTK